MCISDRFSVTSFVTADGFSGPADLRIEDGCLRAGFTDRQDTHVLRYALPHPVEAAGVSARFRLRNWDTISYVAIGVTHEARYRHIKAPNIRTEAWVDLGFRLCDVIWSLQNGDTPCERLPMRDIRLFIKGTPSLEGGHLDVASLSCLEAEALPELDQEIPVRPDLASALYAYFGRSFRDHATQARAFMTTGRCPVPGGKTLEWPVAKRLPENLDDVSTYRFSWHAQHPAINLLVHAHATDDLGAVIAARSFAESWIGLSFYRQDEDVKFAWYDHGTAERLLAFILLWQRGVELGFDRRFMLQLSEAIVQHGRLLASEAFYAYNQPERYHNHAWFQDAALIAAACAFPYLPDARGWLDTAITRFEDQLDHLIVRDGEFAIFVENSIGYHHGVQRLAEFVGQLVGLSGHKSEIPQVARDMVAWSDFLRYPDGRVPAQGDTFRLPPRVGKDLRRGEPYPRPGCTILPKAGYAVLKGNHGDRPFMLCLFATSLSRTHKHQDNLSITLWFDGIEWLIDPSFYSHEYDDALPRYLRSAAAHNVLFVPGVPYSLDPGHAHIEGTTGLDGFTISGEHTAYESLQVNRTISGTVDRLDLRLSDCLSEKRTSYTIFHAGEDVTVALDQSTVILSHPDSKQQLMIVFPSGLPTLVEGFDRNREFNGVAGHSFMTFAHSILIVHQNNTPDLHCTVRVRTSS